MFRLTLLFVIAVFAGCTQPTMSSASRSPEPIRATVVSYETNAEWDHFDDGTFAARDKLTLSLDASVPGDTGTLSISLLPADLAENSPFRLPGTQMTFTLDEPITSGIYLAWGALKNPTPVR
jgi:hypothetical protein